MPKSNIKKYNMHVGMGEIGIAASLVHKGFKVKRLLSNGEHTCFVFADTLISRQVVEDYLEDDYIVSALAYYDIVCMLSLQSLQANGRK
jgi:hypothetical protein